MKDYKTLTREKVDADPGAARYMSETHLLEDWSDKLLDLVLNGPTLNGFRKDEIRAALRQTYAALKQYEQIGPMASPYMTTRRPSWPEPSLSSTPASTTMRSSFQTCATSQATELSA